MSSTTIGFFCFQFLIFSLSMPFAYMGLREMSKNIGQIPYPVSVSGTGSMYPSFYWDQSEGGPDSSQLESIPEYRLEPHLYRFFRGFTLFGRQYIKSQLQFGDIVAFKNDKTIEILSRDNKDIHAGFIKRVIGLPGDKLVFRNGYVYRNGVELVEPYIYRPRSSYGGSNILDCQEVAIPEGHYFVLGDNRQVSDDSRGELGLISIEDISFYLPLSKQKIYSSLYRDASRDSALASTPTLDVKEAITLLNNYRQSNSSKTLVSNLNLSKSSTLRGKKILATNDFTTTATRSGYTFTQAMESSGYTNSLTGEVVSHGYYTAEEWVSSLKYFAKTKDQILKSGYSDIGLSVILGEVNDCPTQVIVSHFGGYIPPEYEENTLTSWVSLRENLESILPGWKLGIGVTTVDQTKLSQLISILETRLALAKEIESMIKANKWLTENQIQRIKKDSTLASDANQLIEELNQ